MPLRPAFAQKPPPPHSSLLALCRAAPQEAKKTRLDLYRMIDPDYYGFRDEDDGLLVKLEAEQEKKGTALS